MQGARLFTQISVCWAFYFIYDRTPFSSTRSIAVAMVSMTIVNVFVTITIVVAIMLQIARGSVVTTE